MIKLQNSVSEMSPKWNAKALNRGVKPLDPLKSFTCTRTVELGLQRITLIYAICQICHSNHLCYLPVYLPFDLRSAKKKKST